MSKTNNMYLEVLANIFTIDNGKIKIGLTRKTTEPYKGYWMLPNQLIENETIENTLNMILKEYIKTNKIYTEQDYTFSNINRVPNTRVLATSYLGIVNPVLLNLNENKETNINWFSIEEIPKMAYDHKEIIDKALDKLKLRLVNTNVLKSLFPSDFTLPEIQCIYEFLLGKKLDRRNFRKKFINLDLIEDTGYKNDGKNGRPAKLYRFKENIKETNLF